MAIEVEILAGNNVLRGYAILASGGSGGSEKAKKRRTNMDNLQASERGRTTH